MLFVYCFLLFINLFFVVLPFVSKSKHIASSLFSLATFFLSLWCVSIYFCWVYPALIWHRIAFFSMSCFPLVLLYFVLVYPKRRFNFSWLVYVALSLFPLFMAILSFTPYIVESVLDARNLSYSWGHSVFLFYILAYIGATLFIALRGIYIFSSSNKKALKIFFMGVLSALFMGLTSNMIMPAFGYTSYYILGPFFTSSTFVLFMAYALLKYQFLSLRPIIGKSFAWLGTAALFIFSAVSFWWLYDAYLTAYLALSVFHFFILLYLLSFSSLFHKIRIRLQSSTDKLFLRSSFDYKQLLLNYQRQVSNVVSVDQLVEITLNFLKLDFECSPVLLALPLDFAAQKNLSSRFVLYGFNGTDKSNLFIELSEFENLLNPNQLVLKQSDLSFNHSFQRVFNDTNTRFSFFALSKSSSCLGMILLGSKLNQDNFIKDDMFFLSSFLEQFRLILLRILQSRIQSEVMIAQRIQDDIIPKYLDIKHLETQAFLQASSEIGGDYYDVFHQDKRSWLILADVAGHGLGAGLVMFMLQSIMSTLLFENLDITPAMLNYKANLHLSRTLKRLQNQRHVSIAVLCWDHDSHIMTFSGCHESLLHYRHTDHVLAPMKINHFPLGLGLFEDLSFDAFTESSFVLNKGDFFFMATDGLLESYKSGDNRLEPFGMQRLEQTLLSVAKDSIPNISKHLLSVFNDYTSAHYSDDVSFIISRHV
eukprot:COSAG01_NODE_14_length_41020_cov_40.702133_1_plen_705_part_00